MSSAIRVRRSRAVPLTTRSLDLARIERDLALCPLAIAFLAQERHRGLRIRAVEVQDGLGDELPVEGVEIRCQRVKSGRGWDRCGVPAATLWLQRVTVTCAPFGGSHPSAVQRILIARRDGRP